MHGNLALKHPDQFGQALRHRCRNPRCRMKLKAPVDNPHKAFCTPGCYSSFYLKRCLVCEKAKPPGRSDRRFCRKPSCRNQYHRNPLLYDLGEPKTGPTTGPAHLALKSPIKSGIKSAGSDDRPWRIVAGPKISASNYHCAALPIDPDTAKRVAAANNPERIRQEIDWSPRRSHHHADVTAQSRWQPSWRPQWPPSDDEIPGFPRRVPEIV
jgi:hypothetical protein